MTIFVSVLLLVAFCLVLGLGLLSVLQDLVERNPQDTPIFHDHGPIFHHQAANNQNAKSQFAWQSRSHSRAPD
jgi:hypothetical protein